MLNLSCERVKCSFCLLSWACRELDYWWNQQVNSPNTEQMELATFTKDDENILCCSCCHTNVHVPLYPLTVQEDELFSRRLSPICY
jgi:hypothetical protein